MVIIILVDSHANIALFKSSEVTSQHISLKFNIRIINNELFVKQSLTDKTTFQK